MAKNKQHYWFTHAIGWWLSGVTQFYDQLLVKPFQRYKYPNEQPETASTRFYRGLTHMAIGAAWLSLVPFAWYMASSFVFQGAALFGLAAAGYLYINDKAGPVPAAIAGVVLTAATAYAALQALSFVVAPFAFVFGVKGTFEMGYGFFEFSVGGISAVHGWVTNYRSYLTDNFGTRPIEESETLKYGAKKLPGLAKDADKTQANQDTIRMHIDAMKAKLDLRLSKKQPTKIETLIAQTLYEKIDKEIRKADESTPTSTILNLFGFSVPEIKMSKVKATDWDLVSKNVNAYAELFKKAKADSDKAYAETKATLAKEGVSAPGV